MGNIESKVNRLGPEKFGLRGLLMLIFLPKAHYFY
jgi:hypothetical protein